MPGGILLDLPVRDIFGPRVKDIFGSPAPALWQCLASLSKGLLHGFAQVLKEPGGSPLSQKWMNFGKNSLHFIFLSEIHDQNFSL